MNSSRQRVSNQATLKEGAVALLHFLLGQRKSHYAVTEGKGHNAQEFRTST